RDRAIFELGINAGLRVSEICALTVGQVWQYRRIIERLELTQTKGMKPRAIPLNSAARVAVVELIGWKRRRGERLHCDDPLFRSYRGRRLTRQGVDWRWRQVRRACRLSGKVTTHSWRKTFATTLHQLGQPLGVIQKLLGHRSLATTQRYLLVTPLEEEQAVAKLSQLYKSHILTSNGVLQSVLTLTEAERGRRS
ncbi:MAG TPA: hypothetical protein ENI60_00890, partial [Candidatus Fraserbacteria bacterium]|nr:hypothetical protein [Candidatus Fraserbacteria bacterium]